MTMLPTTSFQQLEALIDKQSGEIQFRYLKGRPKQYRFDASRGIMNINGEIPMTKPGKPFVIIPVAYRIFKDSLFEYSRREWLELFFINEKGALSCIMFHGYSVEHFMRMTQDLFYDDLKITQIKITVKPEQKKITKGDNEGKTYYIADFEYEKADEKYLKAVTDLLGEIEIYRTDTIRPTNDMIVWENYPNHILELEKVNGEEENP